MKTNEEIIAEIEAEINPTGRVGLLIGTLFERLKYADRSGTNALMNLKTVYEFIGNDSMAESTKRVLKNFNGVMGRE